MRHETNEHSPAQLTERRASDASWRNMTRPGGGERLVSCAAAQHRAQSQHHPHRTQAQHTHSTEQHKFSPQKKSHVTKHMSFINGACARRAVLLPYVRVCVWLCACDNAVLACVVGARTDGTAYKRPPHSPCAASPACASSAKDIRWAPGRVHSYA